MRACQVTIPYVDCATLRKEIEPEEEDRTVRMKGGGDVYRRCLAKSNHKSIAMFHKVHAESCAASATSIATLT